MFIYSIRASSVKFFGALALSLITLLVLIAVIPGGGDVTADADASGKTIVYTGVKNSGDGAEFLAQFGWVVSDCTESEQITVPAEFDVVEDNDFDVIRTKHFVVKPMTSDEAILQMNLLGHSFYVFRNIETNNVCVVYHRNNGGYGLIETEE